MSEWGKNQRIKILAFLDIAITLILGAILIVIIWGLRFLVLKITGFDPSLIVDEKMRWIFEASEASTFVVLITYILIDLIRHLFKSFRDLKSELENKDSISQGI